MKSITFQRENLYEEVWSKPMTELAKEYGVKAYQLTKACDKLEIPRPESGYWSKLRHGKKVKRKPLTVSQEKEYRLRFDITKESDIDQLLPKGYNTIVVKNQLRNPHRLVQKTYNYLKERLKDQYGEDDYGRLKIYDSGYLNVSVSKGSLKRAMRILDAILTEAVRQGFSVGNGTTYDRNHTYVQVGDDKAYISLQEEGKQNKTKNENAKYRWDEYDYERYTTGKLKLLISSSFYGYSSRRISDTRTQTLEERLDKFFPLLLEITEEERKNRIKQKEQARRAEIARKVREQEEREYQAEMKRREELEQLSEQFTRSEYIYQFIHEVESKIEIEKLTQGQVDRFNEWKKWATKHANRLNPVQQIIETITKQIN